MNVIVSVNLEGGDRFGQTATEAAEAVLAALKGDPTVDTCSVTVQTPAGAVGPNVPPEPEPKPEPAPPEPLAAPPEQPPA